MRERYVMRAGKLVPKNTAPPKGGFVLPDIAPFMTQDGKEITSRSHLREYEQTNGVKQIGNDMATFHEGLRAKVYGEGQ